MLSLENYAALRNSELICWRSLFPSATLPSASLVSMGQLPAMDNHANDPILDRQHELPAKSQKPRFA